jgi:hypothetical protein
MKNDFGRGVWRAYAISLLVAAFVVGAAAQEPSPPRAGAGGLQKLTGKIHWKKSMGMPKSETDPTKPMDGVCSIFWVAAYEAAPSFKLVWFDNDLKPGRADADEYACSYSITLPANQRLLVRAGMGSKTRMFKDRGSNTFDHNYNNEWWGDTERVRAQVALKTPILNRAFKPFEAPITLSSTQATWLKFEMIWVVRTGDFDIPSRQP